VTWQLTAYHVQRARDNVFSDVEFGTVHVNSEPSRENLRVPVENFLKLLQYLEMEAGSEDLAMKSPLLTCKCMALQPIIHRKGQIQVRQPQNEPVQQDILCVAVTTAGLLATVMSSFMMFRNLTTSLG
jgi:hypothetical protein